MTDSLATKLAESAVPHTSIEYYAFLLVVGGLVGWVAYLYFNNKKAVNGANTGKKEGGNNPDGNPIIVKSDEGLQQETLRGLERLQRAFDRLESKFETQLREVRVDLKAEISEIKAETVELRNAYGDIVHERGDMMAIVGELKGMAEANKNIKRSPLVTDI